MTPPHALPQCPDCGRKFPVQLGPLLLQMVLICRPPSATVLLAVVCPGCRRRTLEVRVRDLAA